MTWFLSSEVNFATTIGFMAYNFGFAFGYKGSKLGPILVSSYANRNHWKTRNLIGGLFRTLIGYLIPPLVVKGLEAPSSGNSSDIILDLARTQREILYLNIPIGALTILVKVIIEKEKYKLVQGEHLTTKSHSNSYLYNQDV